MCRTVTHTIVSAAFLSKPSGEQWFERLCTEEIQTRNTRTERTYDRGLMPIPTNGLRRVNGWSPRRHRNLVATSDRANKRSVLLRNGTSRTRSRGAIRQDVVARQDEELTLVMKCVSDVCHIFPDNIYCAKRRSSCRGSSSENRRCLTADCAMPGNLGKIDSIFSVDPLDTQYATIEDILADRLDVSIKAYWE